VFDGLGELGNGFVRKPLAGICDSQIIVEHRGFGFEEDPFLKVPDILV
jgi:hypothetical protein